jgi:exosortase
MDRVTPPDARVYLPAALVAAFATTAVLFWRVVPAFHRAWLDLPYTHGYLVLAVVGWLLYDRRRRLAPSAEMWRTGAWIVAGGSLAWLIGSAAQVVSVQQLLLLPMLVCAAAAVLGRGSLEELASLGLAFTFALPYWNVFTPPLQAATVFVATGLLSPLGVPAQVDGSLVVLEHGSFVIAASCAGLAFFVSGAAIGYLYGLLFLSRWRDRVLAVGLSTTIAIVGNWIRVTSLIWIGHASEMQSSLVETHGAFGWAIFTVGLVVFVQVQRRVERRRRATSGPREDGPGQGSPEHDVTTKPEPTQAPLAPAALARRILVVTAVAAIGPLLYGIWGALPTQVQVPVAIEPAAGWLRVQGEEQARAAARWTPAYNGFDEARSATWTDGTRFVHTDELVFREQTQGAELVHSTNHIAHPDSLVRERRVLLDGSGQLAREAVIRTAEGGMLIRYWYNVAGIDTDSDAMAKVLEVLAFFRRRGGASLVSVGASCGPSDCAEAAEALGAFLASGR